MRKLESLIPSGYLVVLRKECYYFLDVIMY